MVLDNKLGITDSVELAIAEEKISKKRAIELFESGYLNTLEAGTFSSLVAIHHYLFDDVYDFAGNIRNVNMAKGNFRFAPLMYLHTALDNIEKMPQSTCDEIIEKYIEMNIAHPFREGNGRSMRIWLNLILKNELGHVVDWSLIDKEDYFFAMECSPIKDIELKRILKQALTDKVDDREIYMKGIDQSYYYEGYLRFKTKDLLNGVNIGKGERRMMTNPQRRDKQLAYKTDSAVWDEMTQCKMKLKKVNSLDRWEYDKINKAAKEVIPDSESLFITPPFYCEYGTHIKLGNNFYANYNCVMLDVAQITIGDNCMFGPNVSIYTAGHPVHPVTRNTGYEYGKEVSIGDNCWIGGSVTIAGGVKIGNNVVIGAGSVVTKDIPDSVIAVGNPCRVLRKITDEDRRRLYKDELIDDEVWGDIVKHNIV